jgi:hypothetical protein
MQFTYHLQPRKVAGGFLYKILYIQISKPVLYDYQHPS